MTNTESNSEEKPKEIPYWANGDNLRQIEKDVVIPNMMKKKAKLICKEYLDSKGFYFF